MSRTSDRMAFGPSSLSRLECRECKETTLHKFNACIHCGTVYMASVSSGVGPKWNARTPQQNQVPSIPRK